MSTSSPCNASGNAHAPLMRRQSSQSSQNSKHRVQSPGSAGEPQPLRHTVKAGRHTKIVLPRNHSSGRNLAKLARQAQYHHAPEEARKNSKQKDTEIRLPGSLDDNKTPPMRRNLTTTQLPRNTSHTKLKKNLSHGQLARLGSGKNLSSLNPGPNRRNKRAKSEELDTAPKDLHEQEVELAQKQREQKEGPKKAVGFAVGSSGDSDTEDAPAMEGSGLQDDEWTDQSASASPYSTRQNTANNSRRPSMAFDKPHDKAPTYDITSAEQNGRLHHEEQKVVSTAEPVAEPHATDAQNDQDDESDDDTDVPSPRSMRPVQKHSEVEDIASSAPSGEPKAIPRSALHLAKDHPNPATRHLLSRSAQSPAPALVSNVSALDDTRSAKGSPAPSMRSARSSIGQGAAEQDPDELVSRFLPSASHPSTGSGGNTAMNTPKTSSLHTPENESTLAAQHGDKPRSAFGPVSPGSTISGSSGATTPAVGRSRTELRMMTEKAMADMEDAHANNPVVPPHVFDRRNESLKSYLSADRLGGDTKVRTGLGLGPELFEGRFRVVDNELKMVQRFRDPVHESVSRLQKCKGSNFAQLRSRLREQKAPTARQIAKMPASKSVITLPKQSSKLSTSTSPPKSASPVKSAISGAKSTTQLKRSDSRPSRVSFAHTPAETREVERNENEAGADEIARQLWNDVGM
ncbi:hypothetical protein LTR37_019766 [Vermiconidia calcicola]|uniref:Uncharacterized protein n=1 Tax=Vermiconidia calcicola TaxID=1690605 RepID=A0ACC3MEB9_9PEZI|nr:hypothetical protein LTR37_019766 [Vermiconidia calcicola]